MIVGCGAVAQRLYRKPLQQLQKEGVLQIDALVDPAASHAETIGAFFPRAVRHADMTAALDARQPDLTLILSPAHLHCGQTIAAVKAGSHVLCEKPLASTEAECRQMTDAAADAGRVLAVGMIRRFFPAYESLRRLLNEGRIGTLAGFEYREGHKFEWEVTTAAAFRPRREGGTGVLFDIGPHAIDHLQWTFGDLAVSTYQDDALAGVESNASLDLRSASCNGALHLSWNQPQANELRVTGDKGEAVLRIGAFDQLAVKTGGAFVPQPVDVAFPADALARARRFVSPRSYPEAIYAQVVQTVRAITLGEPPAADAEAGRRCVALLESALSMARPLSMPWLETARREAYLRLHWKRPA